MLKNQFNFLSLLAIVCFLFISSDVFGQRGGFLNTNTVGVNGEVNPLGNGQVNGGSGTVILEPSKATHSTYADSEYDNTLLSDCPQEIIVPSICNDDDDIVGFIVMWNLDWDCMGASSTVLEFELGGVTQIVNISNSSDQTHVLVEDEADLDNGLYFAFNIYDSAGLFITRLDKFVEFEKDCEIGTEGCCYMLMRGDGSIITYGIKATVADVDGKTNRFAFSEATTNITHYPNPTGGITHINYSIKQDSPVQINLYNITGQVVQQLENANQKAGEYHLSFDAARLPEGIYFYTLETTSESISKKLIVH